MADFKIGIAQVDYTPRIGLPMAGNFRDDYASRGIHDPLLSRALVFSNATGEKVALLSVDICMLDRSNVKYMRERIAAACGITNVLIAATHTHSGPSPYALGALPKADDADVEVFLDKAASAVALADSRLTESSMRVGHAREDRVSFNRRLKCKDGTTHMNWEHLDPEFVIGPWGEKDPELIAVSIDQDGKTAGVLVNFALHPAVLAGDNWLYSADYPGYLREGVQRLLGQDVISAFFNGCCGSINNIDYSDLSQGRGFQMTQRIGYMLSVATFEAIQNAEPIDGNELQVSQVFVPLKRLKITEEQKAWSEKVLADLAGGHNKGQVDGLPDEHYAITWLQMYEVQDSDDMLEVMVIRIGDLAVVGMPGELFAELGMAIKKGSPAKNTIVVELANDSAGYFPIQEAFSQGGYEPSVGSTYYEPGSGEKLVEAALVELRKLFATG